MPIQYTEQQRGQSYAIQRELGTGRKKPEPANIRFHLKELGYSQYSVNEVATWAATTPDSRARQLFDLQGLLQVEPELARAFLRDRGQDPRVEPCDKLTVEQIHAAVEQRSGRKVAIAHIQEWVDTTGRMYSTQYFPSSALPKIANSAAAHFLRISKK